MSDASFSNSSNLHKSQVSGVKRLHRRNCECSLLYRSSRKLCLNDLCKHCLCHTVKSPTFGLHQPSLRHVQSVTRDPSSSYKIQISGSILITATESQFVQPQTAQQVKICWYLNLLNFLCYLLATSFIKALLWQLNHLTVKSFAMTVWWSFADFLITIVTWLLWTLWITRCAILILICDPGAQNQS